jgi:Bacterial surface protein, Ig-like domain/Bacterial Ig domain/Putative Ig domain/FG-GAP-like repeat
VQYFLASLQFFRALARPRFAYVVVLLIFSGTLQASGWSPFARDDEATVARGGTVAVLDNGESSVLANDFDIERDPLTAFLSRGTRYGELTLNRNGTFIYRHYGQSKKDDEFRYRAFDGTSFSREAKVRIKILEGDPIPPEITGQKDVLVDEDSSLQLKPGDLEVFDPDSNFPKDFTIEVNDGRNYTRDGSVISPVANFNDQLSVPVRVYDGTNFSNLFSLLVEVRPRNDAPFATGGPADQEAIEGLAFTLSLAGFFDDIDDGDVLRFSAGGLPPGNSLTINPVSGVLSGVPQRGDARTTPYTVSITATDTGGASASLTFDLLIFPDDRADLAVNAAVVVNPVMVGESVRWQVDVFNKGPADLEDGSLTLNWSTSGPALTISAPQPCMMQNNGSSTPSATCNIAGILANNSLVLDFQGTQSEDGDNTIIAVAIADDPKPDDNAALAGSQVIARFSEGPTQILSLQGAAIDSGDIDGDGNIDIVAVADETLLFFNSGNRDLATPGQSIAQNSAGNVVILLDWNGDAALDIAVGGMAGRAAELFVNDGSGKFSSAAQLVDGGIGTVHAMAAADLDLDGSFELILTGSDNTIILRRSGQGTFNVILPPVDAGIDVAVGDFDNDSFPDIAVVEAADRAVAIMINSGNGSTYNRTRQRHGSVAHVNAADLNDDGLVDLLLAIDGSDLTAPENKILYRQAGGGFSVGSSFGASVITELLAGDVDADGFKDIAAINDAGVHQLYRGDANGNFVLYEEQIVSSGMRSGVLVDFNDDQSFDLIMAGSDAVEIHANNGIGRLGLGDRRAPDITLLGEATVTLAAGSSYEDAGATANDDIDGDLNDAIITTGSVNTTVVGTYTINYSVSDRAGNTSSTLRTVTIKVNEGVGGGGGGAFGPLLILCLLMLAATASVRPSGRLPALLSKRLLLRLWPNCTFITRP